MIEWIDPWSAITMGFLGSLLAGLCTSLGALPLFLRTRWSEVSQVLLLSAAAGVMLAATVFSLLVPAIELASESSGSKGHGAFVACAGLLLGAVLIWSMNHLIPHEHFIKGPEGRGTFNLGRNWLFILAIALHNFPEGMSVGISFAGGLETGLPVAIGIGIQNIPEGLAVAAALSSDGFSRQRAFGIATLTGLIEPVGGVIGAFAVSRSDSLLPWGLSFAGGAMLYVIFAEIVPETHRQGLERRTTMSLILGFVLMMLLDVWLA